MNKFACFASTTLLALSSAVFAEGFYFQGGGGAGFVSGGINQAGIMPSQSSWEVMTPIIDDTSALTGEWIVGVGYMFSNSFGLEANYLGYSNTDTDKTNTENNLVREYRMSTNVWQLNLMGVARTPFEIGLGFFVKAKAGLAYTDQQQDISASDNLGMITYLDNNQSDKKFSPVLGIGIERDMTSLVSASIEYMAAINNEVENSAVFITVKFNPFDVASSWGY
jgi:opacity protein-like surface antigen